MIDRHADYGPLDAMIGGTAALGLVEENWEEVLRSKLESWYPGLAVNSPGLCTKAGGRSLSF